MQRGSIVKVPVQLDKDFVHVDKETQRVFLSGTGAELYSRAARQEFVFLARSQQAYYCTHPEGGSTVYKFAHVYPVKVRAYATQSQSTQSLKRALKFAPCKVEQLSLFS
jgi:hypothetical protein